MTTDDDGEIEMEFFCYHRDRDGSGALRAALVEEHWAYMDGYAGRLTVRGPTFRGDTATGSVHVVTVPDVAAARAFALDEPGYQAGVYRDVLLRRWQDLLGRSMWDFPGGREAGERYLVLGLGADPEAEPAPLPASSEELIAFGSLLSDDGAAWIGTAAMVRAAGPAEARRVLVADRYASVEVHRWQFGGRPESAP